MKQKSFRMSNMLAELNSQINLNLLSEALLLSNNFEKLNFKKDIAALLLNTLQKILPLKFLSFVEKSLDSLKVICQSGDSASILNLFNKEMSEKIFDWVIGQKQLASLTLAGKQHFIFIPLIDQNQDKSIVHGMIVLHLNSNFTLNRDLNTFINIICKVAGLSMTKLLRNDDSEKYTKLKDQIEAELSLTAKLQKSMSGIGSCKKLLFSVLEDEYSTFNGNIWWLSDLGADISLVLFAQVLCKGAPAAMLGGFLLGEMNSLKTKAEISLQPKKVLKHLNGQFNSVFKSTGITFNAWYGVFNIEARKIRFANANHPDPFLIGPEQQVSNLISKEKSKSLGINPDSNFVETESFISSGSRLVICTNDLLEQAAKIGNRYDPGWLPQVLETLGSLSLSEMRNSLDSILSENVSGTVPKSSRLALLLEIPFLN